MIGFRRLSIRWRITIGSVLVAAILLTGAAFVFRGQIQQVQINSDKKLLYGASTPYIAQILNHPTQIDKPAGEEHVAVVNPAGKIVTSNLPDTLSDRLGTLRVLNSGSHFLTFSQVHYLVTVETVATPDGEWRILGTRNEAATEAVLANLTNILVIGAGVLLIGFGLASWLLTTAALRPVTRMRRRAETLRASGSPEPLPVGPANDELAELANTLNDFIASVRVTAARERQMVSDASHELRTPIAVLKAQLELAHLSEGDAAALRNDLTLAEDSVDRLSKLATNLLELSALEAEFEIKATDWQSLVTEFVATSDRARVLALSKKVRVEFDVEESEDDLRYRVSTTHFGQILDNLTSNAIRAAPEGGAVSVRFSQRDGQLWLVVDDSGPGMPDSFIPVAFDRFSRPDEQRGGTGGGSGLGLSIVSAIVSNAGGEVSLANRDEGGFTVEVTLPAVNPSIDARSEVFSNS
jgi:two-component system, OmpR family, sensor kinase